MQRNKGFTLIELLIVIAIVGILAAAILPRFTSFNLAARDATTRSNIAAMRGALIQYRANEGDWPAAINSIAPIYIEKIPSEFLSSATGSNVTTSALTEVAGYSNAALRNSGAPGWVYGNYSPATSYEHGRSIMPCSTSPASSSTTSNSTNSW
ncbi:MAG: prepilin-type N-terminal cleavage/methylation domain-containing protein [Candidatus Omnitrophica bacterium]|nr:prepilin-type N-terminal cleavage/methylation domain-containing protein [Candidatus Omnitrophota bacterium]